MIEIAKKTTAVFGTAVGLTAMIYILYLARGVVFQLFVALFIAIAIEHFVRFFEKYISRLWASLCAFISVVLVLVLVLAIVAVPLTLQTVSLLQNIPHILDNISRNSIVSKLDTNFHFLSHLKTYLAQPSAHFDTISGPVFDFLTGIASGLTSIVILFMMALFLSIEGPGIWKFMASFFDKKSQNKIYSTAKAMALAVSGFVSGNLFISLIAFTVTAIVLFVFHVPYALPLALLLGLFDLIPLVGAATATVIIGFVSLSQGLIETISVVCLLFIYQFIESHILSPVVYSKAVQLSPLVVLIACLAGAEIAGILGALLAIPIAAALQILIEDIYAVV